ncbi:MAG TPA: helix-turn-helix transcriptional regulator [Candidatus Dormibacteraeota bacterium]|jgi:transcriptional regulator with XRE-family HTH domain
MSRVSLDPEKVVAALNRKSLSQRELARRTGVSETTVSHLVRGIPVSRHKAAQVIRVLVDIPDVDGMADFLPCV